MPKRNSEPVHLPADYERLADLALRTKLSGAKWRQLEKEGRGPRRYVVGRSVLYRRAEVDAWLEAHATDLEGRDVSAPAAHERTETLR
jgi:predicted DNA-binding transcriptional regulator AlpA